MPVDKYEENKLKSKFDAKQRKASTLAQSFMYAIDDGIGFDEWIKKEIALLSFLGFVKDIKIMQKNGKTKQKLIFQDGLEILFNFANRLYYAKRRYDSQMKSLGKYFRYVAVIDNLTNQAHASIHNIILPKMDPFWDRFYPPNGLKCRCQVQVLTDTEVAAKGYTITTDSSNLNTDEILESEFFAENFGKLGLKVDLIEPFIQICELDYIPLK